MDLEASSFYVCVYEYYEVFQCNLFHFKKLNYVDLLAKVSSESVVLFRVRIACRKCDQPSIYFEASKCDQYEKKPLFKVFKVSFKGKEDFW